MKLHGNGTAINSVIYAIARLLEYYEVLFSDKTAVRNNLAIKVRPWAGLRSDLE